MKIGVRSDTHGDGNMDDPTNRGQTLIINFGVGERWSFVGKFGPQLCDPILLRGRAVANLAAATLTAA